MKKSIVALCMMAAFAASAQVPYKVIAPIPDHEDGTVAYMVNYDTGERVDSATVKDHKALFTGDVDDPFMVRILVGNNRYGNLVLEQGTCTINQDTKTGVGTMLNDQLKQFVDSITRIEKRAETVTSDAQMQDLIGEYIAYEADMIGQHTDDPIAYFIFMDYANMVEPQDAMDMIARYPSLKEYAKVQKLMGSFAKKLATSPGQKFVDFEITYDGVTKRLSDYVGKGDYVLVDFWASWCGPCMREIETLRDIYNEYSPKGLKVLGVAVWDQPDDTKGAISRKKIPWECIIDAQSVPTDLYGIQGIPCIILFGPDGTIISRDLQGSQLKSAVAAALGAD